MKPMELKVFPIWENELDGTCYTGTTIDDVVNVDYEVYRKRLTPHELAAEWWRQSAWFDTARRRAENYSHQRQLVDAREREYDRLSTVERFATLPHASEADYE